MSKLFNLDRKVPSIYGEEDYTFREGIEKGLLTIKREVSLDTNFKPRYFVHKGFFKFAVNGNQAKKYLKEDK